MKEIAQTEGLDKAKEQVVAPVHNKKPMLIGSIRAVKGLTLFEMSRETKIIEKTKFEPTVFNTETGKAQKLRVKFKENHIYTLALNEKNARRKISKLLEGAEFEDSSLENECTNLEV